MPGAGVGLDAVDGHLHLVASLIVANPHDAETRFLPGVKNSHHVTRTEIGIEPGQQSPAQADVTGAGLLQEVLAPRVYTPHEQAKVNFCAGFATAIDATNKSHA